MSLCVCMVCIVWCDAVSEYFIATNGVKQGGVLSPVLFCIYLDNLLVKLSESGSDILLVKLLSASLHMQMMLFLSPRVRLLCVSYWVYVMPMLPNSVLHSMPVNLSVW